MEFKENSLYFLLNPDEFLSDTTYEKTLDFLRGPQGVGVTDLRDTDGSTYLHRIAAVQGNDQEKLVPVVYQLACQGIDPNSQDNQGNTALHKCLSGDEAGWPLTQALIRIGSDLTIKNNDDKTPLDLVTDDRMKDQFVGYGQGLPAALASKNKALVERLLKNWCLIPTVKKDGIMVNILDALKEEDPELAALIEQVQPTLEFIKVTLAGDTDSMKRLFEEHGDKIDVNVSDSAYKDFWTGEACPMPLLVAAMSQGNLATDVVATLLGLAPKLDTFYKGIDPAGPLIFAVENSTNKPAEDIAKIVMKQGDLGLKDSRGQTIAYSAQNRSVEHLIKVLEMGVDVCERDDQGHTVIDDAIFQGNNEQAAALQKYVLDTIFTNPHGRTDTIEAMAASCFDWLWKVIGADGKTVKDLAEEKGLSDVLELVELAKEDQGKVTTLLKAAKAGNLDEIKKILDADPKLASYKNKSGRCILHQAVLYEQKEVVEYLVGQYEALVGAKDNLGRLPLHYAAAQTDGEEMYAVLAGAGSDEDAKDWNNLSGKDYKKEMALHADDADAGHYNVQAIIERERSLKYGSAVTVKQNYNAMAECIENNDIQGVRNIERNLEVPFNDIQKVLGLGVDPLLFICARTGAQDIAKAFIDDGADLEINREDGTTLIDYVKTLGLTDLHKIIANKIKADHEAATIPLQKQLSVESLTSLELEPIIPEVPIKDVPPPSTIDGKYLAQNVGAALEEALAEICQKRPHDPVEYLAQYLYKYDNNMKYAKEQRRIKYDLEKERIAEENEHRRRKRREIEAAKIRQEEAERRQQQDELVRKRQSQLEEEQKQLEMDEHMKRERENAEKYAQPPDLATVNEDPREDDQEKATPASQQLAEGEVGEVTVKVEEVPPTPADGDAPGDGTVSESVDEAPGEGTEQTDEGGAE